MSGLIGPNSRQPACRADDARLLEDMNADFERLNEHPAERRRYDVELRDWDATLLDGLEQQR